MCLNKHFSQNLFNIKSYSLSPYMYNYVFCNYYYLKFSNSKLTAINDLNGVRHSVRIISIDKHQEIEKNRYQENIESDSLGFYRTEFFHS